MNMYDNENTVQKSFDDQYLSEDLLQAQWAEFTELKKVISEVYLKKGSPLSLLDIGIGSARIARHMSAIPEMWRMIESFEGTDNAEACIKLSQATAKELQIEDKLKVHLLDAINLDQLQKKYDLIICTWFTPGNFYPEEFPFSEYNDSSKRLDLSKNEKFTAIFSKAYSLLQPNGEIILGACYIDNNNTRKKQEQSYLKMGMKIITNANDSFTATKEKFWSQRFTPEKIKAYLPFVKSENIVFVPLDPYDYAMQIRIKK
ncbi:class I SAM-dependent methyltransferase [Flavobacterium taihuense]|uniref:Class I SAM-dependent methyltransferase n=1 Tax=Flavobacterium taihuense TaxID=2857508 RepID=A0ABS6XTH8_9FLAO|nr:class I SAM-dependent methyltransferase [Flavobacterium taihuense]MBW4359985.1 class I SAM-dependent methyltransferase [Flavobacterium taihuense]